MTATIFSLLLSVYSCKKKTEVDNETQSVVDNAVCEQQFMSIQPVINEKGINEKGIKKELAACETFTILSGDTTDATPKDDIYDSGPVTFQIDYGTVGCLGSDGTMKKGKINITTAKKWRVFNHVVTIDLVEYKVNNISYSGQIKITKVDSVTITTEVINGHCTDGTWHIDYAGTKTLKQIGGYSTKNISSDDVFTITGNSSGKNRENRTFTSTITNPLVKKVSCKYITSGTLELTPDGFKTRTVDFGNGNCDDDATFSVNGQTVSFKLK